jgi:hypothetical protein
MTSLIEFLAIDLKPHFSQESRKLINSYQGGPSVSEKSNIVQYYNTTQI